MFVWAEIPKIKLPKPIEQNEVVLIFRGFVFRYYLFFGACNLVLPRYGSIQFSSIAFRKITLHDLAHGYWKPVRSLPAKPSRPDRLPGVTLNNATQGALYRSVRRKKKFQIPSTPVRTDVHPGGNSKNKITKTHWTERGSFDFSRIRISIIFVFWSLRFGASQLWFDTIFLHYITENHSPWPCTLVSLNLSGRLPQSQADLTGCLGSRWIMRLKEHLLKRVAQANQKSHISHLMSHIPWFDTIFLHCISENHSPWPCAWAPFNLSGRLPQSQADLTGYRYLSLWTLAVRIYNWYNLLLQGSVGFISFYFTFAKF